MGAAVLFHGPPGPDGWAAVSAIHYRPDDLDEARRAEGVMVEDYAPPVDTAFWTHTAHVHRDTGAVEHRLLARPVDPRAVRALFTHGERRAIKLGDGLTDTRTADLAVLWEDALDRDSVTLDDPALAGLLDWLVEQALLTPDRRSAIAAGASPI